MPGEHWCNICEVPQLKGKGTYLKLYRKLPKKKNLVKILCPECKKKREGEYAIFDELWEKWRVPADGVESAPAAACTLCNKRMLKSKGSLTVEFREKGEEWRVDVCHRCIDKNSEILKAFDSINSPNPIFEVDLNCLSEHGCESFKKPKKNRGINCGHVCINVEGELYCRRGHPGNVKIYRERWALPPNRKQLMMMLKEMSPLFKQMSAQAKLALDHKERFLKEIEKGEETQDVKLSETFSARGGTPQAFEIPDTFRYNLSRFPIENSEITLPWNANIISIDSEEVIALIPIKE